MQSTEGESSDGESLLRAAALSAATSERAEDAAPGSPATLFRKPGSSQADAPSRSQQPQAPRPRPPTFAEGASASAPQQATGLPAENASAVAVNGAGREQNGAAQPSARGGEGHEAEDTEPDEVVRKRRLRSSGMGGELGGFTQMSWLKVPPPESTRMRGRGIPVSELRRHKKMDDAWTVVRGKVYDITPYMRYHPGGEGQLMKGAGKDATTLFNKYHPWVNIDFLLEKCFIGFLVPDP